jgi:hypothetical protein
MAVDDPFRPDRPVVPGQKKPARRLSRAEVEAAYPGVPIAADFGQPRQEGAVSGQVGATMATSSEGGAKNANDCGELNG